MELSKKQSSSYKLTDELYFNEKESNLFDFLLDFIERKNLNLVMRCAGGFVRDKILKLESEDIDIALDKMTGEAFVKLLKQDYEDKGDHLNKVHIIKSNPEKSKHLETATCEVQGFEIDFVNLRGEEYAQDSRIPTIQFGSPEQDALRRDLTINSLFYNINEGKLEDYTNRGLKDLKKGICMTPLDPFKTFIDDPLRILRTVRFMSRYDFQIEPEVLENIKKPEVQESLFKKVSPERIGKELQKILKGNHPFKAIQTIWNSNLWKVMFPIHQNCSDIFNNSENRQKSYNISYDLVKLMNENYSDCENYCTELSEKSKEEKQLLFYFSAGLVPYQPYTYIKNKKKDSLINYIIVDQHRLLRCEGNTLKQIVTCAVYIKRIIDNIYEGDKKFIKLIQIFKEANVYYQIGIFLAKLMVMQENNGDLSKFDAFIQYYNEHKFEGIYKLKPLLKGEEIAEAFELELKKIGPVMRTLLWNITIWQIENQDKGKKELLEEIKEDKSVFFVDNHIA